MTKVTFHLKSGKTFVNPDDGLAPAESARDMQRYLASPGAAASVPSGNGMIVVASSSIDYVELEA